MTNQYTLRKYKRTDAADVVSMLNANRERPRSVVDGAGNIRLIRYVPFSCSKAIVEDTYGQIVGYAYVADKENSFVFETGGGVHPEHWKAGIGSMLLHWAEEEAHRLSRQAPAGIRCVLQANLFETERESISLFEAENYGKVRTWAHYEIHFDGAPLSSNLLAGITIRPFDLDADKDWDWVSPVQDEAFMDHWGAYTLPPVEDPTPAVDRTDNDEDDTPLDFSYSNAQGFCFIAFIGKEVAGGILCNAKLVEFQQTGRVGSVFTSAKYRRHGVGRNLMLTAFNTFYQNGMRRVILDTDAESFTDSFKFYNNLGMNIYRREFLYEKQIRAGREIRKLHQNS